ncbi:MAG TPA: DUF4388 domain-containing protein [Polyangiaceae bacterium]
MSLKTPLSEISGVSCYAVGDIGGNMLSAKAGEHDAAQVVAATTMVANTLSAVGHLLGLGITMSATVRGESNWVIAFKGSHTIAVELEAKAPLGNVETQLQQGEWVPTSPSPMTGAEIVPADGVSQVEPKTMRPTGRQAVPPAHSDSKGVVHPPVTPPKRPNLVKPPTPLTSAVNVTRPSAPPRLQPPRPVRNATPSPAVIAPPPVALPASERPVRNAMPSPAVTAPSPVVPPVSELVPAPKPSIKPNFAVTNVRGFRRAFVRGDLKEALLIADHLKHASPSPTDPCGSGASARAVDPLSLGIAAVLSGDNGAAIDPLTTVVDESAFGPSLRWLAMIWLARANLAASGGLDQALTWAEQAGHLSKQLDSEAKVVSARLISEVCLHRKNLDHAARFAEQARRMSETTSDREEFGEILLLQAKILSAAGQMPEALAAAERAYASCPNWLPPIIFLIQSALLASDLERVATLLRPFEDVPDAPTDIARVIRLFMAVRENRLPATAAAEFLELSGQPPGSTIIARLEALASTYPELDVVLDTLGWKLLKAGKLDRAAYVFERLSQQQSLSNEVRASVMLALGYLAASRGKHSSSGAKIRATVDSTPKHLQVAKAATPSCDNLRTARPIDLASITPPASVSSAQSEAQRGSTRTGHSSPVFTGNLNHFSLPDVLEFLRAGRRTGILLCSSVRGVGAIHLANGYITGAAAPHTSTLHGLLVSQHKITERQAVEAAEMQKTSETPRPIGTILVNQGWCTANDVIACLRAQIGSAVSELLQWGDGQFAFDPEAKVEHQPSEIEVAVDPQALLLDIFKLADEAARGPN